MEIFRSMIVGYADKRVGYNTLWERSDEEGVGRNFCDVWPDGRVWLLTNNNRRVVRGNSFLKQSILIPPF
jgi:hypothetical protein